MPDQVPDEVYGHPINLLGENALEQMGRGLFIIAAVVANPERKWWWDTGRYEISDELRRIGQAWVNLSKTHVLQEKQVEKSAEEKVPEHYHVIEYISGSALKDPENPVFFGLVKKSYDYPPSYDGEANPYVTYHYYGSSIVGASNQDRVVVHKLSGWDGGFCDDRCLALGQSTVEEVGDV